MTSSRRIAFTVESIEFPFWSTKIVYPLFGMMFLFYLLIPPKDTLYAIAASEFGEKILESSVGNKATQALEAWLDKQIPKKEGP